MGISGPSETHGDIRANFLNTALVLEEKQGRRTQMVGERSGMGATCRRGGMTQPGAAKNPDIFQAMLSKEAARSLAISAMQSFDNVEVFAVKPDDIRGRSLDEKETRAKLKMQ